MAGRPSRRLPARTAYELEHSQIARAADTADRDPGAELAAVSRTRQLRRTRSKRNRGMINVNRALAPERTAKVRHRHILGIFLPWPAHTCVVPRRTAAAPTARTAREG